MNKILENIYFFKYSPKTYKTEKKLLALKKILQLRGLNAAVRQK